MTKKSVGDEDLDGISTLAGDELPKDFPERSILADAGINTFTELDEANLSEIPGIGETRAARIQEARAKASREVKNEEVIEPPELVAARETVEVATEELAVAEAEAAAANEKVELAKANVEEAKAAVVEVSPPKTYFVHTTDEVYEAKTLKEYPDGARDLEIGSVLAQKFVSGASSGAVSALPGFRGRVRKGFGRADVGSYFIE